MKFQVLNGKKKITKDKSFDNKLKFQKASKKFTNLSFSQKNEPFQRHLPYYNFGYFPIDILEVNKIEEKKDPNKSNEDNYHTIITERKEKIKKVKEKMKLLYDKKPKILEALNDAYENINKEKKNIISKIYKIKDYDCLIDNLKKELINIRKEKNVILNKRDVQKKLYELSINTKPEEIILVAQEVGKEKDLLSNMKTDKDKIKNKILDEEIKIKNKIQEINDEKLKEEKLIQEKNIIKEEYDKVNKIAINDNKYCHENFFSLLIFFPYFKNVAFISNSNEKLIEKKENEGNFEENKIITEEEINYDIEKENINDIIYLINQRENGDKNINFKILKDRRTLQINPKEKYKFKKIFSTINNNYIAEPWTEQKYHLLKLSTINSYFNEFNMTAISNNYFIIYFLQNIDKTSLNSELFKLFQKLENNE